MLEITTELVEDFYANARDPNRRDAERKQAAVALGVATDKWLLVSGRPTQIIAIDAVRPEAHALASKLALVRRPGAA